MKKGKRNGLIVAGIILAIILLVNFFKVIVGITGISLIIYGFSLRNKYKDSGILTTKPFWIIYSGFSLLLLLIASLIGTNNTFFGILMILLVIISILLIIGIIKPSIAMKLSKIQTRKHVISVYGITILLLLIASGIVVPPTTGTYSLDANTESAKKQDKPATSTSIPSVPAAKTPSTENKTDDASKTTTNNPDATTSSNNSSSQSTSSNNSTNSNKTSGSSGSSSSNSSGNTSPTPTPKPAPKPSYRTDGPGPNGETIKGNINSKGEKIYHSPGGQFYDKTIAEEWFFTPEQAEAAG